MRIPVSLPSQIRNTPLFSSVSNSFARSFPTLPAHLRPAPPRAPLSPPALPDPTRASRHGVRRQADRPPEPRVLPGEA
ncbi:hypothetical protein ZWY2020_055826 [Hordeum vulgare]|nr:hypothetical protein ZWY2020_055826 [Hordeum vulgare]